MKRNSKFGFNLVEMAIALVIVAIGIMSIVAIFPSQLYAVRKTQSRAQMDQFVQSVEAAILASVAAGVDYDANGFVFLPPIGGTKQKGGMWIEPGNPSNMPQIRLNNTFNQLHFVDVDDPTDSPNVPGTVKEDYVNQALWYRINKKTLDKVAQDHNVTAPNSEKIAGMAGHRLIFDLWPGDVGNSASLPSTPVGRYITDIYE